jgi:dolichyl-phosphate beta-glucosyltransferase
MWAFHMCVAALCSRKIRDTQCGFKLFTAHAAKLLFSNLHLQRWAFDIELVTIAQSLSIPIVEVGVQWREVDGSKLDTGSKWSLLVTSLGMLRDMICVRLCYSLGIWKIKQGSKIDEFSSSNR